MVKSKKSFTWWLGLIIATLTAIATYLSSCSTHTEFSLNADSIEKPNINFSDSTSFNPKFYKK